MLIPEYNEGLLMVSPDQCLGYLIDYGGRGIFDAEHGSVYCSSGQATKHNQLLDEAMLKGLDDNCQVGQHGVFYYCGDGRVTTFCGTLVAWAHLYGKVGISFVRKGRTFKGRIAKNAQCVTFKRTA